MKGQAGPGGGASARIREDVFDVKEYSFSMFPNESFLDLQLFQYGWEQCEPLYSYGPHIRNHYLFHYVIDGQGFLDSAALDGISRNYSLSTNQGFLICPGQVTTYWADQNRPWKYAWVEFDGLRVSEYLGKAGLTRSQPIYTPDSAAHGELVRDEILYLTSHAEASPLHLIGHLFLFLDHLMQTSSTRRETRGNQLRDFYIQEAITYMEQNFQQELTVEEIADVCKLNRSYFSKLFKENMGCPPQEFLIRLRLTKAMELMKTTNNSIGDISGSCGYPNQLHFSRAFKKRYGVSPREWRAGNS